MIALFSILQPLGAAIMALLRFMTFARIGMAVARTWLSLSNNTGQDPAAAEFQGDIIPEL